MKNILTQKVNLELPREFVRGALARKPVWLKYSDEDYLADLITSANFDNYYKKLEAVGENLVAAEKEYKAKVAAIGQDLPVDLGGAGQRKRGPKPAVPLSGSPHDVQK